MPAASGAKCQDRSLTTTAPQWIASSTRTHSKYGGKSSLWTFSTSFERPSSDHLSSPARKLEPEAGLGASLSEITSSQRRRARIGA